MPKVNLVPKEERSREFRRQFYIIPVAGMFLIVVGMVGLYVYFDQQLESSNEELARYQQNNANQRKEIEELDRYEAISTDKQEKQVQVMLLEEQRHKWSRTLDDIAFVVPDDIWFKSIEGKVPWLLEFTGETRGTADAEVTQDFIIEGRTRSMASIAVFMVRLGLIPSLTNVELIFAEKIEEDGGLVIQFEVGASLAQNLSVSEPAIAPSAGEDGPSDGTGTGTSTTATDSTGTTATTTTGTGTRTGR